MSRTIGKHWHAPRGDRQAACDYCGVVWLRSQLTLDDDNLLRCPDEGEGGSRAELDRENAEGSTEYMGPLFYEVGGVPPATDPVDSQSIGQLLKDVTF